MELKSKQSILREITASLKQVIKNLKKRFLQWQKRCFVNDLDCDMDLKIMDRREVILPLKRLNGTILDTIQRLKGKNTYISSA